MGQDRLCSPSYNLDIPSSAVTSQGSRVRLFEKSPRVQHQSRGRGKGSCKILRADCSSWGRSMLKSLEKKNRQCWTLEIFETCNRWCLEGCRAESFQIGPVVNLPGSSHTSSLPGENKHQDVPYGIFSNWFSLCSVLKRKLSTDNKMLWELWWMIFWGG